MTTEVQTHAERLLWLAEQEIKCPCLVEEQYPQCDECADIMGPGPHASDCSRCGGADKVPHFPTLRQKCPICEGGRFAGAACNKGRYGCQGRGWVLAEAHVEAVLTAFAEAGYTETIHVYAQKPARYEVRLVAPNCRYWVASGTELVRVLCEAMYKLTKGAKA